jgi:hypothetical protein
MLFNPGFLDFDNAPADTITRLAPAASKPAGAHQDGQILPGGCATATPAPPRPELTVWRPRTVHEWLT